MAGASRPADAPAVAATVRTTTWFAGTAVPGSAAGVAPSTTPGGTSLCSRPRISRHTVFGGVTAAIRPAMSLACSRVKVATATVMSLRVTRCATTSRISVDFPAPGGESTTVTGCPDHTRYRARAVTDPTTIRGNVSSGSTTGPSSPAAVSPGFSRSGSRSTCPNMPSMCAAWTLRKNINPVWRRRWQQSGRIR